MNVKRSFIPGSEWLYIKIYTGYRSADNILVDYLLPFVDMLKNKQIIHGYFFVRYTDPYYHIRFRIHISNLFDYGIICQNLEQIFNPCLINGLVWNIQCDTYKRELERYGEDYINEVEKIFCIDSESIIRLIQLVGESINPDEDRWKLSLLLLDQISSIFDLELKDKQLLFKQMSTSFREEFSFLSSTYTKQLNDKFRANRKTINEVMSDKDISLYKYENILNYRKNRIGIIVSAMNYDFNRKFNLLKSLVHMTMNRLFRSRNRLCELVVYDFMNRYYESVIARLKLV